MVILDRNSNIKKQGATEILRVCDDFSNIPSWLSINGEESINSADSLVLARDGGSLSIETRAYNVSDYDAIFFQLGSFRKNTQNTIDSFYFKSNSYEVAFKNVSSAENSKIGCFHNGVLIEEVQGSLVWNNGGVVNKPCTYSINYNINLSLFTLISNGAIIAEVHVPALNFSEQYSIGFSSNSNNVVLAQVVHKLWKSL